MKILDSISNESVIYVSKKTFRVFIIGITVLRKQLYVL